jgi:hypothetical protein
MDRLNYRLDADRVDRAVELERPPFEAVEANVRITTTAAVAFASPQHSAQGLAVRLPAERRPA